MKNKGFTLIELLIVMAIITAIAALTMPVGLNFYRNQILDNASDDVLEALNRSRNLAVYQENDSAFGVRFLIGAYVLFQGDTYASRNPDYDEEFDLPAGAATDWAGQEMVWTKLAGVPTNPGTITVTMGDQSRQITVSPAGVVEKLF